MFRFLRRQPPAASDPLQSPKTVQAWLCQLPARDVLGRHQHVIRLFAEFARSTQAIDLGCVAAIEVLDVELGAERGQLLRQFVDSADPSTPLAQRLWSAAYETSQAFIAAYRRVLGEAAAHADDAAWKPFTPRLCARLVHFYGTDAKLKVLRNERWIPAKWVELHEIYLRAAKLGVERTPPLAVGGKNAAPRTVEQEYLAALLTHLLNTGTMAAPEIEWSGAQIRAWSRGLILDVQPPARGGYYVDIAGRSGLTRRAGSDRGVMIRYLDTTPLAEQIQLAIASNRQPRAADPAGDGMKRQLRVKTLEKLRSALAPDLQPSLSREPRVQESRDVELRIGYARICQEPSLHAGDDEVFAATENPPPAADRGRAKAAAGEARNAANANAAGECAWRLGDRSLGGMRIKAAAGAGQGLALGTLVAVRDASAEDWVLGIVRRLNRSTTEIEAGIAIVARRILVVALNVKRQAREDMSIVVDGIDVSTIGARFDGLYLPPPSRPDNPINERTVVVPTKEYADGRSVIMVTAQAVYTLVLRRAIEQRFEWTWSVMEIAKAAPRQ